MEKLNRFQIVSTIRAAAKSLKEMPEDVVETKAQSLTKAIKEVAANYEVITELVRCIDTSRLQRLADVTKNSFAARKVLGDGKGLRAVAAGIDMTEQVLGLYHKVSSAFVKDQELAKNTVRCVCRHTGNAINALADIMEKKDFDNPSSIFDDKDSFEALESEAKAVYKAEFDSQHYVSLFGPGFDILLRAYNYEEARTTAKRLEEEIKKEASKD